jgi:hypothetical protein
LLDDLGLDIDLESFSAFILICLVVNILDFTFLILFSFGCELYFSFICMFCRSLFVLLYFFYWPLCCLFFFDIRILIAPLASSNSFLYSSKLKLSLIIHITSCSTSDTHHVNLFTNPVISREWGKDREVFTTNGTYPWSFVTQIFHNGQPSRGGDRKIF